MFSENTFRIILAISLMMYALNGRYLLVSVEEQKSEFKGKQSTSISNPGIQMKKFKRYLLKYQNELQLGITLT